jgi:hypothetical protein
MGDCTSETFLELEKRQMEEDARDVRLRIDNLLHSHVRNLCLNWKSIPVILKHIDYFVSKCQRNKTVKEVHLCKHALIGQDDGFWDKVGQAIGNFQALYKVHISAHTYPDDDDDEDLQYPDWAIPARILSHVRQRIILTDFTHEVTVSAWRAEDARWFARAIHGHPTITRFEGGRLPYESMDALYSALATLPALESVSLSNRGLPTRPEDESALANPESLTELLRVPSLRSVCFHSFSFTHALCQATANALMEGTVITKLEFREYSFSAEESAAIMANGLARNTVVVSIEVDESLDAALIGALAAALPSNSTLRELSFLHCSFSSLHLSPVFLALGKNTGLKTLKVDAFGSMDESLCTAMQNGIGVNETLESLELGNAPLLDDNADLWRRGFSFLRTNKALKSLVVDMNIGVMESCLYAFRIDIVAMLQDNTSLESLSIFCGYRLKADEYIGLVTALQHNTTLKSLKLFRDAEIRLTEDGDKQMASLLKKNYALESLDLSYHARDVGAILQLNRAGRRYLIEDGSSISKGVEVLSRVKDDINCIFLHLLENPRLCGRRAVEMVTAHENNGRPTNSTANIGGAKREHASAHGGNEFRRRLV